MPKYRLIFVPRGSYTVEVEAPDAKRAWEMADLYFDNSERVSSAEWDEDSIEDLPDDAHVELTWAADMDEE